MLTKKLLLAATSMLLMAQSAFCQFETAAVLGTVFDPRGAVVRDAIVTLANKETGVRQRGLTDAEGNYQFLEIRLGQYNVRVEAPGFKKSETPEFRVTVGARQRVNVSLQIGEVSQTVEVNSSSAVYDLPFGRGLRYGSSMPRWLDAMAGGWVVSGINTMASGQQINPSYDPSAAFVATDGTKNSAVYTANVIGNIYPTAGQQSITNYFNTANVLVPTDVTHPYGNAGRNIGRSNAFFNFDSGIHKQFTLWKESSKLEFRSEFFNTLNKTNFSAAYGDRSNSSFGRITSTLPARQVQFALRLLF